MSTTRAYTWTTNPDGNHVCTVTLANGRTLSVTYTDPPKHPHLTGPRIARRIATLCAARTNEQEAA